MKQLTGFSSQPKQTATFFLDNNVPVYFYMQYVEQQSGWFANLLWNEKEINGLRLTTSPNLLLKWKNVIPFGLAILTDDNSEPLGIDDFATGKAKVYLLNADDVETVSNLVLAH